MTLLDRYVLTKFFLPFNYCFLGFLAIWFIFDLNDNLSDFLTGHAGFLILLAYYESQIPDIVVMCLPIAALLALLYSLSAMSRSNEIISMLGAGRSVIRVLIPLFIVGILLTALSAYFSFELAPHAALMKKQMMREIKSGKKRTVGNLEAHLYRNRDDLRTWFMKRINIDKNQLIDVEITQQDADANIIKSWYAQDAYYDNQTKSWTLYKARTVDFDKDGNKINDEPHPPRGPHVHLRLARDALADFELGDESRLPLGARAARLSDLQCGLQGHAPCPVQDQLQQRLAAPFACILVVCIAAPLGIVYSRRGILAGVMTAIGLYFCYFMLNSLFIAFGKGSIIPPIFASWSPVVLFMVVGCILLWMRSTSRDLPKLKLPWT